MPKRLPFKATSATGQVLDISFPLHSDTESAIFVSNLISTLLQSVDREIKISGPASNGDVLQALAMATAIRAGIIHAPEQVTGPLAMQLVSDALAAVFEAERPGPAAGHA